MHGSTASTGGSAPFIVVNGPIRLAIGMNTTHNALANASRANATIGRSMRLILLNVLGGIPGQLDRSTLGHPGKFTFCVAEDEEDSPWLPLSVERGMPAGTSAVTALQVESPHQIMNEWTHDPKEILDTYAAAMRSNMLTYSIWEGNYAFVIPKQHREIFAAAGWTKQNIRDYTFEAAHVKRGDWRSVGKAAVAGRKDEEKVYRALRSPDDLLVVAAGGPAGGFGAICRHGTEKNRWQLPFPSALNYSHTNSQERSFHDAQSTGSTAVRARRSFAHGAAACRRLNGAVVGMIDNAKIGTAAPVRFHRGDAAQGTRRARMHSPAQARCVATGAAGNADGD